MTQPERDGLSRAQRQRIKRAMAALRDRENRESHGATHVGVNGMEKPVPGYATYAELLKRERERKRGGAPAGQ